MAVKNETMRKMVLLVGRIDNVEDLALLNEAIVTRSTMLRNQRALENRSKMQIGDRVRVSRAVRPKYLGGLTGTIKEFDRSKVVITLDIGPCRRFVTGEVTFRNASPLEVL